MSPPKAQSHTPPALWSVSSYGKQIHPIGHHYWYDNEVRQPGPWVIQATLAGQIIYRDHDGEQLLDPGQIVIFCYGEKTAYGQPQPLRQPYTCLWLNIHGAGLAEHLSTFRKRFGAVIKPGVNHPLLAAIAEIITISEPTYSASDTDIAHALHRLVMQLFEYAQHRQTQHQSPVQRAIDAILARPNQPYSLQQIADRHGCAREHLSRQFQLQHGHTPSQHLADARLHLTLQLLRNTSLPIADIAHQAGYGSSHTLARCVRQSTGLPPSAHRHIPLETPTN